MSFLTNPSWFGGAAPPALEFRTSVSDVTSQATYTLTDVDIGAADPTRRVIAGVTAGILSARTISSATIGGVTAAIHAELNDANADDYAGFISALVPTGTTATFAITMSSTCLNMVIGSYRLINETVSTPHATATTNAGTAGAYSVSINVPANGALVAAAKAIGSGGTWSWSGATERYDTILETLDVHSGASESGLSLETGRAVTATFSGGGTNAAMAVLTWG